MFLAANVLAIVIMVTALTIAVFMIPFLIVSAQKRYMRTQSIISDRDILLMILSEPDRMMTVERLVRLTPLTKSEARTRLYSLRMSGILRQMSNGRMTKFYSLYDEDIDTQLLNLDDTPYLSTEDILQLFQHFDYNVDLTKLCFATNLPIKEIKREMNFYKKEGVIEELYHMTAGGVNKRYIYLLKEPYRSDPDLFLSEVKLDERHRKKAIHFLDTEDTV